MPRQTRRARADGRPGRACGRLGERRGRRRERLPRPQLGTPSRCAVLPTGDRSTRPGCDRSRLPTPFPQSSSRNAQDHSPGASPAGYPSPSSPPTPVSGPCDLVTTGAATSSSVPTRRACHTGRPGIRSERNSISISRTVSARQMKRPCPHYRLTGITGSIVSGFRAFPAEANVVEYY